MNSKVCLNHSKAARFFVFSLVIGFVVLVMWAGLGGGFVFDDYPNIVQNKSIHLEHLDLDALRDSLLGPAAGPSGRPVSALSFALTHYFFGLDPFAFKAVNLAIHATNGLLVFLLGIQILSALKPEARRGSIVTAAGFVATAWLLHPIQATAIFHVVQRMTSLSAFFLLAAMLLHIRGRASFGPIATALLLLAWGVCWPLSFFSKETGILFPIYVLAWELVIRRSSCGCLDRFARILAFVLAIAVGVGVVYLALPVGGWVWSGYEMRSFSLTERLATEARVLWFYLELIFFPRLDVLGLHHDDIAISAGLLDPRTTLPAMLGLGGLVWVSWRTRLRVPVLSFGVTWFLIGHGLESTFLPLEIAHEHRNYLPLFGVLFVPAWGLMRAIEHGGREKEIAVAFAVGVLLYFSFVSAMRAHQFGDEYRRTQVEAQHHRMSPRAQLEAGSILIALPESADINSPIHAFARAHLERAGEIDATFKQSWLSLIELNCHAGVPFERRWLDELVRRLQRTPFGPGDRNVLYRVKERAIAGSSCLNRADVDGLFIAALSNPSVSAGVAAILNSWYSDYLWLSANDLAGAKSALAKSLSLVPSNSSNQLKWAQLLLISGEIEMAKALLISLPVNALSRAERQTRDELLNGLASLAD